MPYKAKATRNDDGSYALSYGKGSKKLTAMLVLDNTVWAVKGEGFPLELENTKREAIAKWGEWAASSYEGSASGSATAGDDQTHATTTDAPHSPHSGPPKKHAGPPKKLGGPPKKVGVRVQCDDDDAPLPVWPADRDVIATTGGYDVCQQVASDRFPYLEGFAIVERKTNTQTGWTKQRERAFESLLTKESNVREVKGGNAKALRASAPVAAATASAAPAKAEATDDHASQDDAESGVPSGSGADPEVQSELFGTEESASLDGR